MDEFLTNEKGANNKKVYKNRNCWSVVNLGALSLI